MGLPCAIPLPPSMNLLLPSPLRLGAGTKRPLGLFGGQTVRHQNVLEEFMQNWPWACPLVSRGPYGVVGPASLHVAPRARTPKPTYRRAYLAPSSLEQEKNKDSITGTFSFSLRRSLSLEDWSRVILGRSPMRSGVLLSLRFVSASGTPGCCAGGRSEATGAGPSGLRGDSRTLCPASPRVFSSLGLSMVTVSLALRWVPASPLSPGGCFMLLWCQRRFWL